MNKAYYDDFTKRVFIGYLKRYNPRLAEIKKLCKQFVFENDEVLEIGCGIGFIAKNLRCKSYLGLDQSEEAVRLAKLFTGKAEFMTIDFDEFATDKKYDAILLFDVIEHLENRKAALKRLVELLKDDGRVLLTWPSPLFLRQVENKQIVDNEVTIQEVVQITGLEPIYLRYFGVECENQYIHLILSKSSPKFKPLKQNQLKHTVKSWLLRIKNLSFWFRYFFNIKLQK